MAVGYLGREHGRVIHRARLVPSALAARRGMLSAGYRRRLLVEPVDPGEPAIVPGSPLEPVPEPGSPAPAETVLALDPAVAPRRPAFGHPTF